MTGGVVLTYRGSWCSEKLITSWESEWRATGSGSIMCWDGETLPRTELIGGGEAPAPAPFTGREGHPGCVDEMFATIARGTRSGNNHRDNIRSLVAMVFGNMDSAGRRRRVEISEVV